MYYCVCQTCREDDLVEEFERAQEYFNEHAERRCEVEIVNVEFADEQRRPDPPRSTPSPESAPPADE
ncbi:hypothetical protein [Halorarum salinum]|uniref:Uncharacterized protein n=1 Tax=Halorarum salinum TaxID=2743089 RepID=A0A7D5LDE7_9EURY|nr:hypothetical protein [Halobaculum salinum]QLG63309.1 hypothetical protein HUG12_16855 [Halobaculum salinum]